MTLLLFLLLQITPLSALFYDDYTSQVNLGVGIDLWAGDFAHQQWNIGVTVPPFSTITVDTLSLSFWPRDNKGGVMLVVIRACGHSIWRKSSYILYTHTLIIPASLPTKLKSPCDHVEVEAHWQGRTGGARYGKQSVP